MTAEIPTITTSRLILRPLDLSDADAIQDRFPQWEIVRLLASHVPWPYPADGALGYIRDVALPAMRQRTEWHWPIRLKTAPDRLIGAISLTDKPGENRGFWLDPDFWGQGLMSEACAAVTDYWFETLERPVLREHKAAANEPSRRISERGGMRLIETRERGYVSGRLPAELWEITREEWRGRRGPSSTGIDRLPEGDPT
jgi:[ribosomal protein S5]-alanine N-acetyltransferase